MELVSPSTEDLDTPPGEEDTTDYCATGPRRISAPRPFLWFVTADPAHEQVFPIADIRRMEPGNGVSFIQFGNVVVKLSGTALKRVINSIRLNRCDALYEIKPGQKRPPAGEPVIERMEFRNAVPMNAKEDTQPRRKKPVLA